MHRLIAFVGVVAWVSAGCGGNCAEVAAIRQSLRAPRPSAPGPHAEVRVPLARANAFLAEVVQAAPVQVALDVPDLGPLVPIGHRALTAIARDVQLRPASDDHLRFALRIEIDDGAQALTTLAVETEVAPRLVRDAGVTELVTSFGPENLVAIRPVLDAGADRALGDAVRRWLPPSVASRVPGAVLDRAAGALAEHLTGAAYHGLEATLLRRLGELTALRIRLPALPIAKVALRSSGELLTIGLTTDLPVRRGLGDAHGAADDDIAVRLSGSTVAELANWAIDHGPLPAHYTRDLEPATGGEFRPYFDFLAEDAARPFKIHVLQERGGCSYFRVGLRPTLEVTGDKLEIGIHDRWVETAEASAAVRAGLWLKQLLFGAVETSRRAAAEVQITAGGRTFTTRAVRADVSGGDFGFALALSAAPDTPAPQHVQPIVR